MRRLVGFLLGAASRLTGGASLHILIPMCLKILYALFWWGFAGAAVFAVRRALVPLRISLMATMASAEAFVQTIFAQAARLCEVSCGLLRTPGTLAARKRNQVLKNCFYIIHW